MLQVDQVGAVLWAYGKWQALAGLPVQENHRIMIERAASYLLSRQDAESGLHKNAFDTWESFVGSFSYSNAAIHAAFLTAAKLLGEAKYSEAARRLKAGVLAHFVRKDKAGYRYLVRGSKADGSPDTTVDSSALGAIEPFGLLDLTNSGELTLALGTLRAVTEHLEVPWQGGHAIRRVEGDTYVGGVPACVNTLWMARCCLKVAHRLRQINREPEAVALTKRAQGYLQVVLRRATPTGLLPELMQGPTGQTYWAAPHGWAMASFVSAVLALKAQLGSKP
jgi:GH15 family glucan-1,4-alpha-glucosidase